MCMWLIQSIFLWSLWLIKAKISFPWFSKNDFGSQDYTLSRTISCKTDVFQLHNFIVFPAPCQNVFLFYWIAINPAIAGCNCIIGYQSMYSRTVQNQGRLIHCLFSSDVQLYTYICPILGSLSNYMKGHSKSNVHIIYCGIWVRRTKTCMLCIGRSHQALKEVVEHLQMPIGKYREDNQ